jgi:hypothetical protein
MNYLKLLSDIKMKVDQKAMQDRQMEGNKSDSRDRHHMHHKVETTEFENTQKR